MTEVEIRTPELDPLKTPGFTWRVGLSIAVAFGWLVFVILWLFFYADRYSLLQNIAIFLVSILVAVGILAATWATWGIRYASRMGESQHWKGFGAGMAVNTIAGVGWLVFIVIWLFYYAQDYNGYQNLAIFIFSLMVLGAIAGSVWLVRWTRSRRFHS